MNKVQPLILHVDDEKSIRKIVKHALSKGLPGAHLINAENLEEALQWIQIHRDRINVVISDGNLKGNMDHQGLQVLRAAHDVGIRNLIMFSSEYFHPDDLPSDTLMVTKPETKNMIEGVLKLLSIT